MINKPAVDDLLEKLSADGHNASRYELCVVASKRARQILDQSVGKDGACYVNELTLACYDIESGKIVSVGD